MSHFSKYGLQDSDEEEEERPSKTSTKKLKTAALPPAGQDTPFQMALNGKPAPPPQVEKGQWTESVIQKLKQFIQLVQSYFMTPWTFEEYKYIASNIETSTREVGMRWCWHLLGFVFYLRDLKNSYCLDHSFCRLSFLSNSSLIWTCWSLCSVSNLR